MVTNAHSLDGYGEAEAPQAVPALQVVPPTTDVAAAVGEELAIVRGALDGMDSEALSDEAITELGAMATRPDVGIPGDNKGAQQDLLDDAMLFDRAA